MKKLSILIALGLCIIIVVAYHSFQNEPDHVCDVTNLISRDITSFKSDVIMSIGDYAFCECKRLTTVDFRNAAWTSIGEYAFSECYQLETAYFAMLTVVDNRAFEYCEKLNRVVFFDIAYGEPFVGDDVFIGTSIETGNGYIYVPGRLLAKAKELFWQYEKQIRAIEDGYSN